MSKVIDKKQAWVGLIITVLPWVLRFFGVEIPSELGDLIYGGISGSGAYVAAKARAV